MDKRTCLGCRFGLAKIEILPEEHDLSEFVTQTQDFAYDISAVTVEKTIHNSSSLRSSEDSSKVLISKIHCSSILNINKEDCSYFDLKEEKDSKIKHLSYNKCLSMNKWRSKSKQSFYFDFVRCVNG